MPEIHDTTIPGVTVAIDGRAVRVTSARELTSLSSAVCGGGWSRIHEIVNMHVDDKYDGGDPAGDVTAFAGELGVKAPFAGMMTAAYTEYARLAVESAGGLTVAAIVSVGLSNTSNAGVTPPAPPAPGGPPPAGTINIILIVDGAPTPSAMVNLVITATEAKTMVLAEWDIRTPEGDPASGTSTDTVVVACTGIGDDLAYAGPATTVGWLAARAVREAIAGICRDKIARDGGRRIGW